jgi:hypothetical protein
MFPVFLLVAILQLFGMIPVFGYLQAKKEHFNAKDSSERKSELGK